jgi:hypothetical protein
MDMDIGELVNKYGFPIIAAGGMGYFIYFIWMWTTTQVSPVLADANKTLIGLIDRVRRLDNDLIRLNQKLRMTVTLKQKPDYSKADIKKYDDENGKSSVKRRD